MEKKESNKSSELDEYKNLRPLIKWSVIIVVAFWVINMVSLGFMDSSERGTLGDMFGAVNAIFSGLAFAGIIVSLYMQRIDLKNQQKQLELNHDEIQQTNKEFKIQNDTLQIQKFENQYYKMIDLHRENVKEMKITFFDHVKVPYHSPMGDDTNNQEVLRDIEGRKIFVGMLNEYESAIKSIQIIQEKLGLKMENNQANTIAYQIFFYGIKSKKIKLELISESFKKEVVKICGIFQEKFYERNLENKKTKSENDYLFKYYPFEGHESRLAHYYRHLFQTIKYVVQQEEKELINYNEARQYLRVLRAQLSNAEQLLLYYNYKYGFGQNWDKLGEKKHQFLTTYRMIHNIPFDSIAKGIEDPREHFKDYINSIDSNLDPLFEWGDYY